jgi:hypothetical protein
VAVLSNDDVEKVFYIAFRTTPEDETGVPHIIEHTVLCGSDKFPVKDPFVELVKGSLNTFLNAMTYPDKTMYPVASYNDQDFKNLMDVYMDAVFHPNITRYEEIFKQEGWHYEMESLEDPITINGVVYNEMKGAYSSPEEVLQNQVYKALFPDNTYSRDSGGNPVHIPELTYEAYLDFYHKYYHPSNSYIYLYGDMDVAERLDWMDREYLCHYDRQEVDSAIRMQQPFEKVKEVTDTYSIASDDPEENKTYLAYSRVVGDAFDEKLVQAFDVLDYALVSAPGSPVFQALLDAGIGEDVVGSFSSGMIQSVFSIVAKNANPEDKEKFASIIDATLRKVVAEGINKESLLARINNAEFNFREANFGSTPKGLMYGLSCMDSWLFDDEKPFLHLECLDVFSDLRNHLNDGYFEGLVQQYLLDNPHGSLVVIKPERGKNNREEEQLKKRLAEYKDSLSQCEKEELVAQTKHLKQYQEEPSPEEDLRKIPMLTRADLKKEESSFSNIEEKIEEILVVRHEEETNGIDYIALLFEAKDVEAEDLGYLGLLQSLLGFVDTKSYRYTDLVNVVNIYTGGITTSVNTYPNERDRKQVIVKYELRMKTLEENLAQAMNLVDEILRTSVFDDTKRLSEIVAQKRADLQVALSSSGNAISAMRALAKFSRNGFYQDETGGVAFYRSLCRIEELLKTDPNRVIDNLRRLTGKLFAQNRLIVSFTGSEKLYRDAEPVLRETLCRLPKESAILPAAKLVFHKQNEGFIDASQIQYVARAGDFTTKGFSYTGAFRILRMILSYDYLWINLRVKGGAYGCSTGFSRNGESYFVSYRDPNLEKTNEVYEHIPDYLRNFQADERDMTKYIIGTLGTTDAPLNPGMKGNRALILYLGGITYEILQKERDEVLNATVQDIRNLAEPVEAILSCNALCVIGNENMIKDAAGMFDTIEKLYN